MRPVAGRDAAKDRSCRDLQDEAQQRRQGEHVDQDVGAKPEERIHVSGVQRGIFLS